VFTRCDLSAPISMLGQRAASLADLSLPYIKSALHTARSSGSVKFA